MKEITLTYIVGGIFILMIISGTFLGVYFQPKWNNVSDCLKEVAIDFCQEKNMTMEDYDKYPHYKYYIWCKPKLTYEFYNELIVRISPLDTQMFPVPFKKLEACIQMKGGETK